MKDPRFELEDRNEIVARVVEYLAAGRYEHIATVAPRSRVTPQQLQAAVVAYGRRLTTLPVDAYELIGYVAIAGTERPSWSVVVPHFTSEEGRSDLSLELELVRQGNGRYEVSIDNLHVL